MSKRLVIYLKNSGNICKRFRPDKKGIHPVLLGGWADKGDVQEVPVATIVKKLYKKNVRKSLTAG
jgi:hypothetical protein